MRLAFVNRSKVTKGQTMQTYETLKHTTWDCKDHVVFIPKYRRKTLYAQLRRDFFEVRYSGIWPSQRNAQWKRGI